jgi:hypothetical protein
MVEEDVVVDVAITRVEEEVLAMVIVKEREGECFLWFLFAEDGLVP